MKCTVRKIRNEPSITNRQRKLIEDMNEFCDEYFDLSIHRTKKEASEYINRNIEQYKLAIMTSWQMNYL